MSQEKKIALITGFSLLLLFTCVGITSWHADPHCKQEKDGVVVDQCDPAQVCPAGVRIHFTSTDGIDTHLSCPWSKSTLVLNYIAFVFTILFSLVSLWRLSEKDLTVPMLLLAAISICTLLSGFGLMIRDVKNGNNAIEGQGYDNKNGTYIVNIIFYFFLACTTGVTAFMGKKLDEEEGHRAKA